MTARRTEAVAGGARGRARLAAGALAVALVAVLVPLARDPGQPGWHGWSARSLVAWPVAALLGAGIVAAVRWAAASRAGRAAGVAQAVVLVVGLEAAGAGIVAARHWEPATGTGAMLPETLRLGRPTSIVLAVAGLAAAVAATSALLDHRPPRASRLALPAAALGVVLALAVPVVIARGDPLGMDVTTLGAVALLTGAPWGAALLLSALLPDAEGAAIAWTCAAAAALQAAAGLLVADVAPDDRPTLAVAALALAALAAARTRAAASG